VLFNLYKKLNDNLFIYKNMYIKYKFYKRSMLNVIYFVRLIQIIRTYLFSIWSNLYL